MMSNADRKAGHAYKNIASAHGFTYSAANDAEEAVTYSITDEQTKADVKAAITQLREAQAVLERVGRSYAEANGDNWDDFN
jgi:hypothetical protein